MLGSFCRSGLDIFSELNLHYIEKEEKERKYKISTTQMWSFREIPHNVNLSKLFREAYDRAVNMSGATKGAASIITAQYPLSVYHLHFA